MNTENVATWRKPVIWVFGEENWSLQWIVVLLVAVTATAIIGNFTTHELVWPEEWVITQSLDLPAELSRSFVLLSATTVDPLFLQEEDEFWSMAATRREHFLLIREPRYGRAELQFLVRNPQDVQPLSWETLIGPRSVGWQGKYSPMDTSLDREAWALNVKYTFEPSPLAWLLLLIEGVIVVGVIAAVYGFVLQPIHIVLAETLAETK